MKKNLLLSGLFVSLLLWTGLAFGQCTPNPALTDPTGTGAMDPDTLVFDAGVNANLTLSIIAPHTSGVITLDSIIVKNIQGKPSWMSYACDNIYCRYIQGVLQCALVYGMPPANWPDTLLYIHVIVDAWNHIGSTPILAAGNTDGGTIVVKVNAANGTPEYNKSSFGILQNQPNPFNGVTRIGCVTKTDEQVNLKVVDMLGNVVYIEKMPAHTGENYFGFTGSELSNGVYFYSITNSQNQTVTRKMVKIE
jgi:hypothetical protein